MSQDTPPAAYGGTLPVDFAPFTLRARAPVSPAWLAWLGAALRGDRPALPGAMPDERQDQWPALEAHGVLPLLYVRLRDDPAWPSLPQATRDALTLAFQASATRSLRMEAELTRIAAALATAGVPVGLLKGSAMGRSVYGSPAERPVSDLDLLVPAAEAQTACRTVAGLGFRPLGLAGEGRLGRWQRRYRAELALTAAVPERGGLLVELHWSLVELPYYIDRISLAEVWAAMQPRPDLPGASLPDPAVLLLHACAHLAFHHSQDLRLIWLVDLDRLARWPALDWAQVLARTERWNLGLAVAASLAAAHRWLGTPAPGDVRARLDQLAADPVGRSMWGLGDERPGRAWRRAATTWAAFTPRQRSRYGAWLALRTLAWPVETAVRLLDARP